MNPYRKALLQLHFTVVLFGFTGILGRLITLAEGPLVWYRMLIASLGFLVLPRFWKAIGLVPKQKIWAVALTGGIVALHWIAFFGSIKYSNVSFALCMLATSSLFAAVVEPLVLRRRISWMEVLLGLLVLPGIFIIFRFSAFYPLGMVLGLASAFLAALFATLNKTFVPHMRPTAISFIELSAGFVLLSAAMPLYLHWRPEVQLAITTWADLGWLLVLGLVCTTLAYVLALDVLKELSAFTSALAVNMEPIYTMVLAALLFGENKELGWGFYLGAGMILSAILLNGYLRGRRMA
ncbi:MAG: DMT family transporter [Bacteroidetes bacterium]|nr:DMT family transporter [Bacteroidota bacterium]